MIIGNKRPKTSKFVWVSV